MKDHLRLFVALQLPLELCAALSQTGRDTIDRRHHISWVRPAAMHLTLKFLGDTPGSQLDELKFALTQVADAHECCRLQLGSAGVFKNRGAPRVLWWGLEGDVIQVEALAAAVEVALGNCGFTRSEKQFRPHITLGRVKRGEPAMEREFLEAAPATMPSIEVNAIHLIQSILHPSGARYRIISTHTLKKSSV